MRTPSSLFAEMRGIRRRARARKAGRGAALDAILQTRKVFVHVPKCGGKSVIRDLYNIPEHDWFGHANVSFYEALLGPARFKAFHSFSFMRDPVDRCRSAFEFHRAGGFKRPEALVLAKKLKPHDFASFAQSDLLADLVRSHVVFRPQASRLTSSDGRIGVNRIYDFASFRAALNGLTGRPSDAPCVHANVSRPYKRSQIPDAAIARIRDLYRVDVDLMRAHGISAQPAMAVT